MTTTTANLEAALRYAARGWPVFPIAAGQKMPKAGTHGHLDATTDPDTIRGWFAGKPHLNVGMATGQAAGVWVLDVDAKTGGAETLMDWSSEGLDVPETMLQKTGGGGRQYFFTNPAGLVVRCNAGIVGNGIDIRGDGGYVVLPPSKRTGGGAYSWLDERDPVDAPQWLAAKVAAGGAVAPDRNPLDLSTASVVVTTLADHSGAAEGTRRADACRLVGCEIVRGTPPERIVMEAIAWSKRCRPAMPLDEIGTVLESLLRKEDAKPDEPVVEPAGDDEYDAALESLTLRSPQWPARPSIMLAHGVVGDLMRRVEHETEADPVAMATTFLVCLGNVIGRGPHAMVDGTRHGINLFAAIVGGTGEGRKGTSLGIARAVMRNVDPDWEKFCRTPNLTSGEGLIDRVRDPVFRLMPKKGSKTGEVEEVMIETGVEDKRLLCTIEELAGTMRAGKSERSTLFQTLREAWDGADLATMAKNARRAATEPHVSIVTHITPEELNKLQTDADIFGGTFNRLLWIASRRARLRPHGGDFEDLSRLQEIVRSVVEHGRSAGRMRRSSQADKLWEDEYRRRASVRCGGVVGAIVGRAEPQILRLAMLAALCRHGRTVERDDLAAALDLWRYCDESARMFFGGSEDPLVARVIEAVRAQPGITRSALHRATAKTMTAEKFVDLLAKVAATGAVVAEREETGGRPREVWHPAGSARLSEQVSGNKGDMGEKPLAAPFSPISPLFPEEAPENGIAQIATPAARIRRVF
jgi:hypothetical protein